MRRFVRENGLSLFFFAHLRALTRRHVVRGPERVQRDPGRARRRAGLVVVVRDLDRLRRLGDGELAVGVPPVLALHPGDDLARPEGLERVEGARGRRARVEGAAADRPQRACATPALGQVRRLAHADLRELAPARDDGNLLRDVVRAVAEQLARVQRRGAVSTAASRRLDRYLGNADFWERTLRELAIRVPRRRDDGRCSRSTCASAARPSRSPSARRTTRPLRPDRPCPRDSP